jgi:hypothetical protein
VVGLGGDFLAARVHPCQVGGSGYKPLFPGLRPGSPGLAHHGVNVQWTAAGELSSISSTQSAQDAQTWVSPMTAPPDSKATESTHPGRTLHGTSRQVLEQSQNGRPGALGTPDIAIDDGAQLDDSSRDKPVT